jgi:hypothetical protein
MRPRVPGCRLRAPFHSSLPGTSTDHACPSSRASTAYSATRRRRQCRRGSARPRRLCSLAAATRRRGEIGRVRGRMRCGDPVGYAGECGEAARRYSRANEISCARLERREAPEEQHMDAAPDESHTASALGGGDGAPGCAQTLSAALFPSEPGEGCCTCRCEMEMAGPLASLSARLLLRVESRPRGLDGNASGGVAASGQRQFDLAPRDGSPIPYMGGTAAPSRFGA